MNVTDEIKAHLHLIRCFADETHERNYGDKKLYIKQQVDRIDALLQAIEPAGVGVAPADVYKVMKRYKDNGRFEWDFVSQMCRDIAALKGDEQ